MKKDSGDEMSKKISVIIPVYNTEKYVEKALSSVLGQTYKNLEIIVIDDKSTDASPKILDEIAAKDSRVHVYHSPENMGHSLARNKGLELAQGDYIGFVDSDDYVHPQLYERLISLLEENDTDIAICRNKAFKDDDNNQDFEELLDGKTRVENRSQYLEHFMDPFNGPIAWLSTKLYKAELFDNTLFKDFFGEDLVINAEIALKVKKVVWTEDKLYAYRVRTDSTTAAWTKDVSVPTAHSYLATWDILKVEDEQYTNRLAIYTIGKLANLYANCNNNFGKKSASKIFDIFAEEYDNQRAVLSKAGTRDILKLFIARRFPAVYCRLATRITV